MKTQISLTDITNIVSQEWLRLATLVAVLPACLVTLFAFDPTKSGLFPPCPFNLVTGMHCPGCGTLRALHQLLHGSLLEALSLNPLIVVFIPILGYVLLSRGVKAGTGHQLPVIDIPAWGVWTLFGVIVLYWILRNVPLYPLSMLAP